MGVAQYLGHHTHDSAILGSLVLRRTLRGDVGEQPQLDETSCGHSFTHCQTATSQPTNQPSFRHSALPFSTRR